MPGPLGRRPPSDWTHVDKYPLMASMVPAKPTPRRDRRQLVRRVRQAGEGRAGPLLDRARRQADEGPRRALRVPEAEGSQRPRRLVGLLQPGRGGRVRRVRDQPAHVAAQPQALRRVLALPRGARRSTSGRARTTTARRSAPAWTSCASAATARSTSGATSPEAIGEGIKANRWARSVDDVLTHARLRRARLRRRPQLVGPRLSPPHPDAREGARAALEGGRRGGARHGSLIP